MTKKQSMFDSFKPPKIQQQQQQQHPHHHHRSREPPIEPQPNEEPLAQIKFYLDRYKIKEALAIFYHDSTLQRLKQESEGFIWDLIPIICNRLRGLCQYRFRVFEGCEKMLCRIASDENCNPKEVLIVLLAELSRRLEANEESQIQSQSQQPSLDQEDDNVFRAMCRPLELTLLRMNKPCPRNENLKWVINVMNNYISNIDTPDESPMDNMKRQELVNHPRVKRFVQILPSMLTLISEFSERPATYMDDQMLSIPSMLNSSANFKDSSNEQTKFENNNNTVEDDEELNEEIERFLEKGEFGDSYSVSSTIRNDDPHINGELADDDTTAMDIHQNPNGTPILDGTGISQLGVNQGCDNASEACANALVSLMYKPLASLDLTYDRPDLKIIANRCLLTLLKLKPNLFSPIYKLINEPHQSLNLATETLCQDLEINISIAVCAFVYNCERLPIIKDDRYMPSIISHEYTLYIHAPFIVNLLRCPDSLAQEKGLILLEFILMKFEPQTLGMGYLQFFKTSFLHDYLLHLMVYSNLGTNRRKAHNIFVIFCDLLTSEARVDLLMGTVTNLEYKPSLRAACIDQYRKNLSQLSGPTLINFLKVCIETSLPDTPRTDVIENYELLMATLTLFRFLRLRKEPYEKSLGEIEFLDGKNLKKIFFDPLRKGLTLTINELKNHIQENRQLADTKKQAQQSKTVSSPAVIKSDKSVEKKKNGTGKGSKNNKHQKPSTSSKESPQQRAQQSPAKFNGADLQSKQPQLCEHKLGTPNNGLAIERKDLDDVGCLEWLLCRLDLMASVLVQTSDLYKI